MVPGFALEAGCGLKPRRAQVPREIACVVPSKGEGSIALPSTRMSSHWVVSSPWRSSHDRAEHASGVS